VGIDGGSLDARAVPRRDDHVTSSAFGEEIIVYHHLSKQYFMLSSMAAVIWRSCTGKATVAQVVNKVRKAAIDPPERLEADVRETVAGLAEFGLLQIDLKA
jgi:hypothetical protein